MGLVFRRSLLLIALCCISLQAIGIPAAATPGPHPTPKATPTPRLSQWARREAAMFAVSAPADSYFGRMKMSYLGINNVFHDAGITTGSRTTSGDIIRKVELADDALRAWAKLYPKDPQLPRSYFLAADLFRRIWVKSYQDRAWAYMHTIVTLFPTTYFGKVVQKELAIGYTEHYYADPVPCGTPPPDPSAYLLNPDASPEPSPTPTPTPAIRQQPAVQLEASPCIPLPTPTPDPTPPDATPEQTSPVPVPLPTPTST
jgi:hypothetical protein